MDARKISMITALTALCIATNYALVGVYQVKVMDFIVFVGGFCLGPLAGASIGIFSWLVYGTINPHGFVPQIWLATMFSEPIYGLVGGLLGKKLSSTNFNDVRLRLSIIFGAVGFVSTLFYDMVTHVVWASVFELSFFFAISFGAPFTILHQVSNAAIFGVSTVPVITVLEKLLGVERAGVSKK